MSRKFFTLFAFIISFSLLYFTSAHVTVKPDEVGVGKSQVFKLNVPTEKDNPTTMVRLVIPEGVTSVRPNVKTGWMIELKKETKDEKEVVTEITWSGGGIPADQRDEFLFSAKVPSSPTTLHWKAYQTYHDGSLVSWDQAPIDGNENESETSGPYSDTKIVDDLREEVSEQSNTLDSNSRNYIFAAIGISLVSILISLVSIVRKG